MKLIRPLVSRTAHSTRSSDPIPSCLRRGQDLAERDPVPREVSLDRLTVLDDDDRLAVEHRPQEGELEAPVGDDHGQHRDRPSREHEPGHREVVLRHALLDEVADHDEQDQVEGLERGELPPAHDPRQEKDEEEREEGAEDDVHLSSGPDDCVAVEGEQQLVAVVELDVLRARADARSG